MPWRLGLCFFSSTFQRNTEHVNTGFKDLLLTRGSKKINLLCTILFYTVYVFYSLQKKDLVLTQQLSLITPAARNTHSILSNAEPEQGSVVRIWLMWCFAEVKRYHSQTFYLSAAMVAFVISLKAPLPVFLFVVPVSEPLSPISSRGTSPASKFSFTKY